MSLRDVQCAHVCGSGKCLKCRWEEWHKIMVMSEFIICSASRVYVLTPSCQKVPKGDESQTSFFFSSPFFETAAHSENLGV